jgi:hypothetical protein
MKLNKEVKKHNNFDDAIKLAAELPGPGNFNPHVRRVLFSWKCRRSKPIAMITSSGNKNISTKKRELPNPSPPS